MPRLGVLPHSLYKEKKAFIYPGIMLYYPKTILYIRRRNNGTYQNLKYKEPAEHSKERRMRRMSDFLSVSMQNFLYCRKPELRA